MELCEHNSMAELLKRRGKLTEFEAKNYCMQILSALKYLQSKHIIHREYIYE